MPAHRRFCHASSHTSSWCCELRSPLGAAVNRHYLLRHFLGDDVAVLRHLAGAERQVALAVNLAEDFTAYMRERPPQPATFGFGAAA